MKCNTVKNYPLSYIIGLVFGAPVALYAVLMVVMLLVDTISYGATQAIGWLFIVFAFLSPIIFPLCVGEYFLLRRGIRRREAIIETRVNYFVRAVYWAVVALMVLFGFMFALLVGVNLFG